MGPIVNGRWVLRLPLLAAGFFLLEAATAAAGQSDYAPSYQIDPGHSGSIKLGSAFTLPLVKKWSRHFTVTLMFQGLPTTPYALVADQLVFVASSFEHDPYQIFALDLNTGKIVWRDSHYNEGLEGLAYDNGYIFALESHGLLRAYDAKTGKKQWTSQARSCAFFGFIATGGRVFFSNATCNTDQTYFAAFDEASGTLQWEQYGDGVMPSLGDRGILYSGWGRYEKYSPSGEPMFQGQVGSGDFDPPVYSHGHFFLQDLTHNYMIDAKTGSLEGTLTSQYAWLPPAIFTIPERGDFAVSLGINGARNTLYCWSVADRQIQWTFDGDGMLQFLPIVVNGMPVIGSSAGNVYMLDNAGQIQWTGKVRGGVTAFSAGQGALIVISNDDSAGPSTVTAFVPG
jgi:outer membrane protein assembly factor BamB